MILALTRVHDWKSARSLLLINAVAQAFLKLHSSLVMIISHLYYKRIIKCNVKALLPQTFNYNLQAFKADNKNTRRLEDQENEFWGGSLALKETFCFGSF